MMREAQTRRWRWLFVAVCVVATGPAWTQSQTTDHFSGEIDGRAFSSTSQQSVGLARGRVTFLMPPQNLLLYSDANGATVSMPGPGLRQRIMDVGPDQPLTLVLTLASAIGGDPKAVAGVTLLVHGVTTTLLKTLPVTARVGGAGSAPSLDAILDLARVTYPGAAAGQLTIDALDLARRSVRGSFHVTTQPGMIGKEKPLTLTNGHFEIVGAVR